MANVDNILAGFPDDFYPQTMEAGRRANERGWWIGNVSAEGEDTIRIRFVFKTGTTMDVIVKSKNVNPTNIADIAEALLTDSVTMRRQRGRHPLSGG